MTSEKMRIKKSVSPCGLYYIENFLSADEATNLISDIDKRKWSGHGIAPNPEMRRRTQYYGYLFSFRYRKIIAEMSKYSEAAPGEEMGPEGMPEFVVPYVNRIRNLLEETILMDEKLKMGDFDPVEDVPLQCSTTDERTSMKNLLLLINEYLPGQGIMPHTDGPEIFGTPVMVLSLLSPCKMEFSRGNDECQRSRISESCDLILRPGSLLVMTGSSRYEWKHAISKELKENLQNPILFHCLDQPESTAQALDEVNESITRRRRVSLTFRFVRQSHLKEVQKDLNSEFLVKGYDCRFVKISH